MKLKTLSKYALAGVIASMSLLAGACGDDEKDEPTPNPGPTPGNDVLTSVESKRFLEDNALALSKKINPADQKQLIELSAWFDSKYAELEFPYDEEDRSFANPLMDMLRTLSRSASALSASGMGRAVETYVYSFDFTTQTGIYEPGLYEWVRKAPSDNIVFRFSDSKGQNCEAVAAPSRNGTEIEFVETYTDYGTTYQDVYRIKIPKTVKVTLTCGGSKLADVTVLSDINVAGHALAIESSGTAANLGFNVEVKGGDTQLVQNSSLAISGENIVTTNAIVNGKHLCDRDFIEKAIEDDNSNALLTFFSNGQAFADIMGKIQAKGVGTFNRDVMDVLSEELWWDSYNGGLTKTQAERAARNAMAVLTKNCSVNICYNGTATTQAQLRYELDGDNWGDSWEYWIDPVIYFPGDETTYSFDEYFERGFGNVVTEWEDIVASYERVWDRALR